jgi:hypothetical protein
MEPPEKNLQTPTLASLFTPIMQWALQALGFAAVVLAMSQNIDLDFSAEKIRTKIHYRGNMLLDLQKQKETQ